MDDLWAPRRAEARRGAEPLALRMRPRTLEEFAGQEHILGEGKLLRRMLTADAITSLILHGPPGTGKTTLAELIAAHTKRHFERENAASVGVKRIREIIEEAARRLETKRQRTILFLDEIHRFTKAQQDVLLGDVERGVITLIGATTENPIFAVNSALVSRSTLFRLELLSEEAIRRVVRRAIADPERGYGKLNLQVTDEALHVWAVKSDGDARRALTALEVAVLSSVAMEGRVESASGGPEQHRGLSRGAAGEKRDVDAEDDRGLAVVGRDVPGGGRARGESDARGREGGAAEGGGRGGAAPGAGPAIVIDLAVAEDSIQQKAAVYDGTGDEHYDSISAMIKSVRGGDPDAALYWIARMLEGGEDPRFIARRLAILASEDIGNADPRGIMVAAACWELVERIGLPEARITLAQCATYLAVAPKSNASYIAVEEALADVRDGRTVPVPLYLRDPHAPPAADGRKHGAGYVYSHDLPDAVGTQDYLGVEKTYYRPKDIGAEKAIAERLAEARARRERSKKSGG